MNLDHLVKRQLMLIDKGMETLFQFHFPCLVKLTLAAESQIQSMLY